MMMSNKNRRSGQILVVSILVVALIMTSTAIYIYEINGEVEHTEANLLNSMVPVLKLGAKHAVIGALANITNDGSNQTLTQSLDAWKNTLEKQYVFGRLRVNYTLKSIAPDTSGLHIVWGVNGSGISEAYVEYFIKVEDRQILMQINDYVNVSTRLCIEGNATLTEQNTTNVTVKFQLLNEGQPALAQNLTLYYRESIEWVIPGAINDYVLVNYANGTYLSTFTLHNPASSLDVSISIYDQRSILVLANTTCLQQ